MQKLLHNLPLGAAWPRLGQQQQPDELSLHLVKLAYVQRFHGAITKPVSGQQASPE
jgi:hypothetical protein